MGGILDPDTYQVRSKYVPDTVPKVCAYAGGALAFRYLGNNASEIDRPYYEWRDEMTGGNVAANIVSDTIHSVWVLPDVLLYVAKGSTLGYAVGKLTEKAKDYIASCLKPAPPQLPVPESVGDDDNLCAICKDKARSHTCYPCGHKCLCDTPGCRDGVRRSGRCPICRE